MTIKVTYNVTDVYVTQDVSPVYINVSYSGGGSGGAAVWGGITGTLSDQTDLQTALDGKFDDPTGTTSQYLRGDGSLATFPSLTGYVPYTGATTNVDLGEFQLRAGQLTLDTSPTGTAAVGTTRWNDTIGSSETTLKGGSVILKNGVDLVARVVNKVTPNTTLTKAAYQAVRVSGAQGQRLAVELAQANNDANSADTIGLVTETIATNQEGFIITVGQIENINTTGSLQGETWADGDVLYLSPFTAGAITKVKPTGNGHIVVIGYVEYAHANNGKIYVKVMNGWELDELHDVSIVSPANNEALIYESSTSLWKNKTIATALGYTPANAATTLTINGVTFDLSTSRTFTVGSVTGSGASGQVAYWTGTSAQSGSNNLFWDAANSRLGIGVATPLIGLDVSTGGRMAGVIITGNPAIPAGTGAALTEGYFAGGNYAFFQGYNYTSLTYIPVYIDGSFTSLNPNSNGNVAVGTATNGGFKFDVNGTTRLNGNVTFSSATGMFWDAANGRLGVGSSTFYTLDGGWGGAGQEQKIFLKSTATNKFTSLVLSGGVSGAGGAAIQFLNYNGTPVADFGTADGTEIGFAARQNTANINFYTTPSGTTPTRRLSIMASGNVLIQAGGTFTDSGERLQVTGTMKVTGVSNFSSNMSLFANVIFSSALPYIQMSPSAWGGSFYLQSGVNLLANAAGDYTGFFIPAARGFGFVQGTNPSMVFAPTSYNVLVGTSTDVASAIFNVSSTTKGFLPPRMTTTQKNAISSPAAGLVVYDTTLNKLCVYTTAWETITSA